MQKDRCEFRTTLVHIVIFNGRQSYIVKPCLSVSSSQVYTYQIIVNNDLLSVYCINTLC